MRSEASAPKPPAAEETACPLRGWFLNPFFQILLSVALSAAAQLFLKVGADRLEKGAVGLGFILSSLSSPWVWAGIAGIIGSLVSWLYALRFVQLIIAFNIAGLLHVIVPLASWIFLGERLGGMRLLGIGLVFAGVLVVAKPAAKMEEEL